MNYLLLRKKQHKNAVLRNFLVVVVVLPFIPLSHFPCFPSISFLPFLCCHKSQQYHNNLIHTEILLEY